MNSISVVAKSLMDKGMFITIDFGKFTEKEKDIMRSAAKINYSDGNRHVFET